MKHLFEAVQAVRIGLSARDALDLLLEGSVLGEEEEEETEAPVRGHRNPFKHPQVASHGYIGPGPAGHIHVPSSNPWKCHGANHQYVCTRTREDGSLQVKPIRTSPATVRAQNLIHREHVRNMKAALKKGPLPERPPLEQALAMYPRVSFRSHY